GFGYTGRGYHGGYWRGNDFYYNRAVNHIDEDRDRHFYHRPVIVDHDDRIAYNGGRGGIQRRPDRAEVIAMRGPKTRPMSAQLQNQRQAAQNRQQFYNQTAGRPATVFSHPLNADRGIQRPVARPNQPRRQPNQVRPSQPNQVQPGQNQQNRRENRPQRQGQAPLQNQPNYRRERPNQPQPVRPNEQPQQRQPQQ